MNTAPQWDVSQLTAGDYSKGRLRHWLRKWDGVSFTYQVASALSMEQEPSPDGVTSGKMTWYDYPGKPPGDTETIGSSGFPSLVVKVLPDGSERYAVYTTDQFGNNTNVVESYSIGASTLTRTNVYAYDSVNGLDLLFQIGPDGITNNSYVYDTHHNVLFWTNAIGELTQYTYNPNGQVLTVSSPSGLRTVNVYDNNNFLTNTCKYSGSVGFGTNTYTYTNGLVYSHRDERGLATTNAWDSLNRLTNVLYPDGSSIKYAYNRFDLAAVIDRMGYTNSYTYDSMRQLIGETNAVGAHTTYGYCDCGSLSTITDPLNNTSTFLYDNAGRRTNALYADGYWVATKYDALEEIVSTTDSSGDNVTNSYNNQGLLIGKTNALGRVDSITYDIRDRVSASTDANNVSTTFHYDYLNRVTSRTYSDSGVETFGYTPNAAGATSYIDQVLNQTTYAYDAAGKKTSEVHVGISTTAFNYSPSGDLTNIVDGSGHITSWMYDGFGRVTNKTDHLGHLLFYYTYDQDNRLKSRWSPAGGTTVYSYDGAGNLGTVDYSGGSNYMAPITFSYDALNRLTNMLDSLGSTWYTYDQAGQLLSEDGPWPNDTVKYTYANRLRSTLTIQSPSSGSWLQSYLYDRARNLTNVTSPAGTFGYTLQGAGPASPLISLVALPGGSSISRNYDIMGRITNTCLMNAGNNILNQHRYVYNPANQRTQQVFTAGNYIAYTYDAAKQLKTASGYEAPGTPSRIQEQLTYSYDAAGNLTNRTAFGLTEAFKTDNLNQLTNSSSSGNSTVSGLTTVRAASVVINSTLSCTLYNDNSFAYGNISVINRPYTLTAVATDSLGRKDTNSVTLNRQNSNYSYDSNGNLLSDIGTRSSTNRCFAYDNENQLVSVWCTNTWRSAYYYDGKMRRRIRQDFTWQNNAWLQTNEIHYVYDRNVVIQERDGNNTPRLTYTRGTDLSSSLQGAGGIGGLLARTDNSQLNVGAAAASAFYHSDGNGNVTALVNPQQAIVAQYEYDPFGNLLGMAGTLAQQNVYRYSSKEFEDNSGLVYYLYRFYDPALQRWTNRDPIEEAGGVNLYCFIANASVNQVDNYGLDAGTQHTGSSGGAADSGNAVPIALPHSGCKEGTTQVKYYNERCGDGQYRSCTVVSKCKVLYTITGGSVGGGRPTNITGWVDGAPSCGECMPPKGCARLIP